MSLNVPQMEIPFKEKVVPNAKPFLKWAGGKSQLLKQIKQNLPKQLYDEEITKYAEPFIGGGALFFYLAANFSLKEYFISDINKNLIIAYRTIQQEAESLIDVLLHIQTDYYQKSRENQKDFFYETRQKFNEYQVEKLDFEIHKRSDVIRTAHLIFLNRTCFNGLYRVNSKGEFNVPFGSYKNPTICDIENIMAVSAILDKTEIQYGDFTTCRDFINDRAFVYFDPPYRPISRTASFNSYAKKQFDDDEQIRLANFCKEINALGAKVMLSNSDPHNENSDDNFFQDIYSEFNIQKVFAKRAINSKGKKRGEISELLIMNY